ncbi:DUF881 domain-containing protein [Populibacterium corticicola]|uniref:DUF881 domain-containing protein n=1 Tax=Populibacterium corticicola TaxID=1812826 RepID=A0ABW5XIV5_9MICO
MAEKAVHRRSRLKSNVSVAIVLMLAAAMFSISAKLNSGNQHRHPEDLVSLLRVETERNQALEERTLELQEQADRLTEEEGTSRPTSAPQVSLSSQIGSGALAVSGPGMRVTLSDAPPGQIIEPPITVDDLVVHQQDLQAVISALWAGGAEAMTLQGQRVTPLTAFKCVGNVLLLHGRVFSPPYVVEVIGDPETLNAALDESESIAIYKQYVAAVGLGWQAEKVNEISLPAASNISSLHYAGVPEGTDIWQ